MFSHRFAPVVVVTLLTAACSPPTPDTSTPTTTATAIAPTSTTPPPADTAPLELAAGTPWTVSGPISGNRVLEGSTDLRSIEPIDIPLGGTPEWVVATAGGSDPIWVVALEDGTLEAWKVVDSQPVVVPLEISALPPGTPPVVIGTETGLRVVAPPPDASALTHPTPFGDQQLAYVTADGVVVTLDGELRTEYAVDALPDARITASSDGLLAFPAEATTRYEHGVLGDDSEAGRIVIIDPEEGEVVAEAVVDAPAVIEGIAAPWADTTGDGIEEILVTVSDGEVGAALLVFDREGDLVAAGLPIGRGNRWRNQLGAGPIGPNGEIEVVDVRVPHIGGVVEYFRVENGELAFQTQQAGFTSHRFGSRNLDMALAADVTGDGQVNVVVPTQDLTVLGVLRRIDAGVEIVDEAPLPGQLTTNIAGFTGDDGTLTIAVGSTEGVLRVFGGG